MVKSHASLAFGEPSPPRGLKQLLERVLRLRCVRCAEVGMFAGYAKPHPECPACGHRHRRESGATTGAMYVSAGATQLFAVAVTLGLWLGTDWPFGVGVTVAIVLVAAFCYAFVPWSIAIWAAVEYWTDVHNRESWAQPPTDSERT